jgi:hypothetical protein
MNVKTQTVEVTDSSGAKALKRVLIASKDFSSGEVIYKVMWLLAASTARVY